MYCIDAFANAGSCSLDGRPEGFFQVLTCHALGPPRLSDLLIRQSLDHRLLLNPRQPDRRGIEAFPPLR